MLPSAGSSGSGVHRPDVANIVRRVHRLRRRVVDVRPFGAFEAARGWPEAAGIREAKVGEHAGDKGGVPALRLEEPSRSDGAQQTYAWTPTRGHKTLQLCAPPPRATLYIFIKLVILGRLYQIDFVPYALPKRIRHPFEYVSK